MRANTLRTGRGSKLLDRVPPPITNTPKPGIYFIEKPFDQSTILLGHQGVPRHTEDSIEIEVFNHIFGSGLGSRVYKKLRAELGLMYSGHGGIFPGLVKGTNSMSIQTKAESTGQAIIEALNLLEDVQNNPPKPSELVHSQRSIENSYVFEFESVGTMLSRMVTQEIYGYPPDYDEVYIDKIKAVSTKDIQNVARRRWDLSKIVIVVVGNANAYNRLKEIVNEPTSRLAGEIIHIAKFDEQLIL